MAELQRAAHASAVTELIAGAVPPRMGFGAGTCRGGVSHARSRPGYARTAPAVSISAAMRLRKSARAGHPRASIPAASSDKASQQPHLAVN